MRMYFLLKSVNTKHFLKLPLNRPLSTSTQHGKQESSFKPFLLFGVLLALGPGYSLLTKEDEKKKVGFLVGIPFVEYVVVGSGNSALNAINQIKLNNEKSSILLIRNGNADAVASGLPDGNGLMKNSAVISTKDMINYTPDSNVTILNENVKNIMSDIQVVEFNGGLVRYGKCLLTDDHQDTCLTDRELPQYLLEYLTKKYNLKSRQNEDIDFIHKSGLEVDSLNGGLLVNSELQVKSNLYCAGDLCSYYDQLLGRRRMFSAVHQMNSAVVAANNMTTNEPIEYKDSSVSTAFVGPNKIQLIGNTNSQLKTVSVWNTSEGEDFQRGIVYYLKKDKVSGVLLYNLEDKISQALRILKTDELVQEPSLLSTTIRVE